MMVKKIEKKPKEVPGIAIASLVIGICSVFLVIIPILGLVLPILAIILGSVSLKKFDKDKTGKPLAIIGICLGAGFLLINVILTLVFLGAIAGIVSSIA